MPQLTKFLERRIQELTTSIESQKTELAAYERVLQMEHAKENGPAGESSSELPKSKQPAMVESESEAASGAPSDIPFSGNKTTLVTDIVKALGAAGASPKDVDAYFTARNIKRSKNLVYNTLSYLVSQKRLRRRDGRYFAVAGAVTSQKKAAPTKRRISPEGLKRIREAAKKRWAAKRAADAAAAKTATKKKRIAKKKAAA